MVIPNLWGAIIGRSGVMKSAVLRAVLGPLRRRQALTMAIYESERDAYQGQLPSTLNQITAQNVNDLRLGSVPPSTNAMTSARS